MKHLEIECKWDANTPRSFARAGKLVEKWGKVIPQKILIKDFYLDHANADLATRKIALRVRNCGGKWEVTYKTRSEIKHGTAVRREESLPLPRVKKLRQALCVLAGKKQWQGICLDNLEIKFSLTNKRTVYSFVYDGAKLEMALDNVTLQVCGRRVQFKEIEVELKNQNVKGLERFAQFFTQQTKLKRAQISKVKTAEILLKMWKE